MPELPEVETICRGLTPRLMGRTLVAVIVRRGDLRHPVDATALQQQGRGQKIVGVGRRGKYLLLHLGQGGVVIHLGMSGVLRYFGEAPPPGKHDHVDFSLDQGGCLRFHDPRRFGAVLWWPADPGHHPLLARLGVEPLSPMCTPLLLATKGAKRGVGLREFLMDSTMVAGIGNIYAAEICYHAGVHPGQSVNGLTAADWQRVVEAIKRVLTAAIAQGGTTLKDYRDDEGRPGYFKQQLQVYGRTAAPCYQCATPIERIKRGGRSVFWCPGCQKPTAPAASPSRQ